MTIWIVIALIILILILLYNSLIAKKNQVDNIFGSVDAILKKRYDLIPNLVAMVKEYMDHERSIIENVTQLRSQANRPNLSAKETIALDGQLTSALGSLMVAVENYPVLKANENMINLQRNLTEIEEQISAARRAYNQAVTYYNNALEMFPSNYMAIFMGLMKKDVFSISDDERKNVNVKELFTSKV